jgi:hypothetical protein
MTRLFAALMFLTAAAVPAFACELQKSVSTDLQKRTVASQPANNHSVPASSTTAVRKAS